MISKRDDSFEDARAFRRTYLEAVYRAAGTRFRLTPKPNNQVLYGGCSFALVTAHNPRSRLLSKEENDARHASLVKVVEGLKLTWQASVSMSPDASWQEAGVIVFNVEVNTALELGRQFEQNAVLYGNGRQVGLLWCDDAQLEYFDAQRLSSAFTQ